jgi:hypothetical protein
VFAVVGLGVGTIGWLLRGLPRRAAVAVLAIGFVGATVGTVAGVDGYPWSNLLVVVVAVAGGILLASVIPPRARPMLLVLVILAALDAAQLLVVGRTGSDPAGSWSSLQLRGSEGMLLEIGAADLVLVVAMVVHGARRGYGFWPSVLAAPLGLLVAFAYVFVVRPPGGLVLLPFLLFGWVLVELWNTARRPRPEAT